MEPRSLVFAVMVRHWLGVSGANDSLFTEGERAWMSEVGNVVPHWTYSLQQETFAHAGYPVDNIPQGRTDCSVHGVKLVIAIATADAYGIFAPGTVVRAYRTVDLWRASTDAPGLPGWLPRP